FSAPHDDSDDSPTVDAGNSGSAIPTLRNEKADRVEFLWGTILASVGNASADVTLKADAASGGSWFDVDDPDAPLPTDGESFYAAPFPKAPADFLASVTIRTSRLSHQPPGRGERVATADNNDFVVTGALGRGGMGVVYSAKQSSLNREVAVKMISPETADREGPRRKMVAEALVTGDLDHPNIIPIYDLGRTESGDLFYAMKIVRGEPWSQSLAVKTERENLDILLRICDAVAFAHDKGIIHRDLKPANVMIGNYGEVLLMDWGLAVSLYESDKAEELSHANAVAGTPAYMAPEMALGEVDRIGTASDIYLLGAILYEVLTGLRPHRGANASECLLAAAENRIEPAFHMDDLVRVALKAMETNPYDRYPTVKDFQNAVVSVQTHRESLVLAASAAEALREAMAARDYNLYAQAIFGYDEALKLWDGNTDAAEGRHRARIEYARAAYEKGDYDLALTTISDVPPDDVGELKDAILAARADVEARKRRIRILTRTAIALTVAVVVILAVATLIISDRALTEALLKAGTKAVAYETIVDQAGALPCLTPMSEIAGRMSAQEGAKFLQKPFGGRGVLLAGVPGVRKANVVILGGGVVGTNAARIAVGLGANVTIMDISARRLAYLDDLFGGRVQTLISTRASIQDAIKGADMVIGAVLIPGRKAPKLILRDDLKLMTKGTVLVDVAVDQGGCFETSHPTTHQDPIFVLDGIVHYCVANMPGAVSHTATLALTNTTLRYGLLIAKHGLEAALRMEAGLIPGVNCYDRHCTCDGVAEAFGLDCADVMELTGAMALA
ncbi:MAG: protein kinase, partial [Planctomycetes bacterium]|nr:protein kinase [Planctomycetota bacterium]